MKQECIFIKMSFNKYFTQGEALKLPKLNVKAAETPIPDGVGASII
jgi:hypothetical protein